MPLNQVILLVEPVLAVPAVKLVVANPHALVEVHLSTTLFLLLVKTLVLPDAPLRAAFHLQFRQLVHVLQERLDVLRLPFAAIDAS